MYDLSFNQVQYAKNILETIGVSIRILNLRFINPFDAEISRPALEEYKLAVTVEDNFLIGGLYSILAELLLKNRKTTHTLPFALKERWFKPALL
ncbi:MAG: hypothetical protein KKB34_15275 [Bacteroidetes bacterium]|nr:hypothetical protein [Bacteroidota bacterium]